MAVVDELWVARDRAVPNLHLYPQTPLDSGPEFHGNGRWRLPWGMFPNLKPGQRCRVRLSLIGEPEEVLSQK